MINGLIAIKDGFAIKNFFDGEKRIAIGNLQFDSYIEAVEKLAGYFYPQSYKAYLLAVKEKEPDYDMWNNLVFIGHTEGFYDHEEGRFKSARQLGMHAATTGEIAYIEALDETYKSVCQMIRK